MTSLEALIILAAAFGAGLVNSIGGGGTMLTFPALLWTGMDPRMANATSTVALWPGSLGGAWGFRAEMDRSVSGLRLLAVLSVTCLLGGAAGAALLLLTPSRLFMRLVPWLLLFATVVFMAQKRPQPPGVVGGNPQRGEPRRPSGSWWWAGATAFQFLVAVYGGYFGAGAGILTLASLGLLSIHDLHRANGIKNILVFCMNTLAVACFVIFGLVWWKQALLMAVGSVAGAYCAATVARRLGRTRARRVVILLGWIVTGVMFWQGRGS